MNGLSAFPLNLLNLDPEKLSQASWKADRGKASVKRGETAEREYFMRLCCPKVSIPLLDY